MARHRTMASRTPNLSIAAFGLGLLVVTGGALWFGLGQSGATPPRPNAAFPADRGDGSIAVHVSGAVGEPGVVSVPADSRVADVVIAAGGATTDADLGQLNLAADVTDGERVIVPTVGTDEGRRFSREGVDINSATVTDLQTLAGVGPVLAARIVSYREEHGAFGRVEDLLDVAGIGEAKLALMRDGISSP